MTVRLAMTDAEVLVAGVFVAPFADGGEVGVGFNAQLGGTTGNHTTGLERKG